ncbi:MULTISPECIES: hypothetical protein [unclassified Saccharicrinis]|uniref:hypothetical protein n=1 Tax=unclassified Saccharicrinis TaxID=2646859 RepID=UPI003D33E3ED
MKKTISSGQFYILFIALSLIGCKPIDKTIQSDTSSTHPKPKFRGDEIGHNETLVTGHLTIANGAEYFVIDTIHMRGSSAPVISEGEKLVIKSYVNTKPKAYKTVKCILVNKVRPYHDSQSWKLILISQQ